MTTTPEYDAILARLMAERAQKLLDDGKCVSRSEARRLATMTEAKMHKTTQMTESECQAEVAEITEGVLGNNPLADTIEIPATQGPNPQTIPQGIAGEGYMTTTGRLLKGKPGRKKGWRKVKA